MSNVSKGLGWNRNWLTNRFDSHYFMKNEFRRIDSIRIGEKVPSLITDFVESDRLSTLDFFLSF